MPLAVVSAPLSGATIPAEMFDFANDGALFAGFVKRVQGVAWWAPYTVVLDVRRREQVKR